MSQQVIFNVVPTADPDATIGHARYVVNASDGIGMDVLRQIVEQYIPTVENDEVRTTKEVIRTDRYECPCCNTDLVALVRVYCEGLVTKGWDAVEGLYRVRISPDHGNCRVAVEKLIGKTIYEGRTPYLPRKDYKADAAARKEIEDREAVFAEAAKTNPGRVLRVDGIETAQDLQNLANAAIKELFSK
jgi:hypothetical protein